MVWYRVSAALPPPSGMGTRYVQEEAKRTKRTKTKDCCKKKEEIGFVLMQLAKYLLNTLGVGCH